MGTRFGLGRASGHLVPALSTLFQKGGTRPEADVLGRGKTTKASSLFGSLHSAVCMNRKDQVIGMLHAQGFRYTLAALYRRASQGLKNIAKNGLQALWV